MQKAPQEMRTYFLTAVTAGRRSLFQVDATAQLMIGTIQTYRTQRKFALYAFVIMRDHIHLLLTPAQDISVEKVMQLIKGGFSFRLKNNRGMGQGLLRPQIPDQASFEACREYIHQNPVRARLAMSSQDYPYFSLRHQDMLDPDPDWFYPTNQG